MSVGSGRPSVRPACPKSRTGWCFASRPFGSRRDLRQHQDDAPARAQPQGRAVTHERTLRPLENPDLCGRAAVPRTECALGDRWPDHPFGVRGLHRDTTGADAAQGRCRDPRQLGGPQEREGRPVSETARRLVPVPATLQSGLEPIEQAFAKIKAHLRKA